DDTHQGGSLHLGATVFPAALAAAELVGASGERVLRAAVAGYDVAARLAMALGPAAHYRRGFHLTATCGTFGAAAAAGAVLGLDAVERVEVGMLAAGFPIVCEPAEAKRRPASVVEAQFSLPFGVAVALARGAASPAEFAPACLRDPTVGALMERVVGVRDPAL